MGRTYLRAPQTRSPPRHSKSPFPRWLRLSEYLVRESVMVTTMARAVLGAYFITTLLSPAVLGQQMCYFPNGSPSPNDTPCRSSGFTHCCNNQSICLGNGFCQSVEFQPYTLSRGSCTDQTWQSPN